MRFALLLLLPLVGQTSDHKPAKSKPVLNNQSLSEARKALASLTRAKMHLKQCPNDLGGSRDRVLAAIDQSIAELKGKLKGSSKGR